MIHAQTIFARVQSRERFSLAEVRRWMADDSDLAMWSAVYDLIGPGWRLIRPEPGMDETCDFITRYLLRCVHEDFTDDENIHSGYDAAHSLAQALKLWAAKLPDTRSILPHAVKQIEHAFRAAEKAERDRLLNGMLEHALEMPALRPFFEHWRSDAELSGAWQLAMEWGLAHEE